jgi:hypothetical protein
MAAVQGEIRKAGAADIGGILDADHIAAGGDRSRAGLLKQCVAAGECLVARDSDAVRRFVIVRPAHFFGRDEGWSFSGALDGLDEGDPELVFFKARRK